MTQGDTQYKPDDMIGRYKVIEILGVGGQSVVYRCSDDLLGRDVAIKHITSHMLADESYRSRMRENITNLARLGEYSDAIVTIHDMFENEQGMFYVMEYVKGFSLEFLMQESPEPTEPRAMLLILFRLAAALHDVHKSGIIHRDIKPSNIVITMDTLRPTIIDFGVAAAADGDASMPLATTKYLAPEIYDGKIDGRADLYSLGFLAYEMLLGRDKFNEVFADIVRDRQASSLRWMKWHSNMGVKAPALHELLPAMPRRLSDVISKLIEKDPEKRFDSAEEFAKALRGNFSGKAAVAKPQAKAAKGAASGMISRMANSDLEEMPGQHLGANVAAQGSPVMDEAPTAPLPKEPLSKGKKIAIISTAAAAVIIVIAAFAFVMWKDYKKSQALLSEAQTLYAQSFDAYKAEQFDRALEGFTELEKQDNYIGKQSSVLLALCKARIAIENGNWSEAQVQEGVAQETISRLKTQTNNEKFVAWLRRRNTALEELKKYRYSTNIYRDAVSKAQSDIARARNAGDFAAALRDFEKDISISDVNLNKVQQKKVMEIKNKILLARLMFVYSQLIRQGDNAYLANDFANARANYDNALALFTEDPAAGLLDKSQQQEMTDAISAKLEKLRGTQLASKAKLAVQQARETGEAETLEKALQNALAISSLDKATATKYKAELDRLVLGQEIAKAKSLLNKGQASSARTVLNNIKKRWPDNPEVAAMLKSIDKSAKRAELLTQANTAYAAGEYTKAVELYKQVNAILPDKEIEQKLVSCRFNLAIRQAQELAKKGDFKKAREVYNSAKTINPTASAQVDAMLVMLEQQQKYTNLLEYGDNALKANRFTEAIKMYEAAAKLQATQLVAKRIRLTKYKKNIVQGKQAIDEDDLPRAKFHFGQALKYFNTAEARDYYKRVGGELKE